MYKKFNINNYVKVKLTKNGHKVYSEFYSKLNLDPPKIKEDKDGYSE